MTTTLDIIRDAHTRLGITVIAHNEREMLRLINEALDELELGPRTGCPACGGSGCDRCIPDEFDNETTGEK